MSSVTQFTNDPQHPLVFLNLGFPLTITLDGQEWPTIEHYFLAMKFPELEQHEKIRQSSLEEARLMAFHSSPCVDVDKILMKSLRAKFQQYPSLAKKLACIKDHVIELKDRDPFLGNGEGTGKLGQNKLGILLATIRAEINNNPDKYLADESFSDSDSESDPVEHPQASSMFPPHIPLFPLHSNQEAAPLPQFSEGSFPLFPAPREISLEDLPPLPDYYKQTQLLTELPERLVELSRPKQTTVL